MSTTPILSRSLRVSIGLFCGLLYLVSILRPHPATVVLVAIPYWLWLAGQLAAAFCLAVLVLELVASLLVDFFAGEGGV